MSAGIVAVLSGLMFPMDVLQSVSANKLTGISATPTALRILCNLALETDGKYESVRFIMCGGQPLDVGLVRLIESIFPNARVEKMYGSERRTRHELPIITLREHRERTMMVTFRLGVQSGERS